MPGSRARPLSPFAALVALELRWFLRRLPSLLAWVAAAFAVALLGPERWARAALLLLVGSALAYPTSVCTHLFMEKADGTLLMLRHLPVRPTAIAGARLVVLALGALLGAAQLAIGAGVLGITARLLPATPPVVAGLVVAGAAWCALTAVFSLLFAARAVIDDGFGRVLVPLAIVLALAGPRVEALGRGALAALAAQLGSGRVGASAAVLAGITAVLVLLSLALGARGIAGYRLPARQE